MALAGSRKHPLCQPGIAKSDGNFHQVRGLADFASGRSRHSILRAQAVQSPCPLTSAYSKTHWIQHSLAQIFRARRRRARRASSSCARSRAASASARRRRRPGGATRARSRSKNARGPSPTRTRPCSCCRACGARTRSPRSARRSPRERRGNLNHSFYFYGASEPIAARLHGAATAASMASPSTASMQRRHRRAPGRIL